MVKQQPQKSDEQDILQKHLQINRSILCPMGCMRELFCVFGDFYVSGTQDTEVTNSLYTLDIKLLISSVYRTRVI